MLVYLFRRMLPVRARVLVKWVISRKKNFKSPCCIIVMMQQPLLPVTVKDGNVSIPSDNTCNRCVCAYILIMLSLVIILIATLIYFSTQQSVFNGNE